jgi:hypothetical protein
VLEAKSGRELLAVAQLRRLAAILEAIESRHVDLADCLPVLVLVQERLVSEQCPAKEAPLMQR